MSHKVFRNQPFRPNALNHNRVVDTERAYYERRFAAHLRDQFQSYSEILARNREQIGLSRFAAAQVFDIVISHADNDRNFFNSPVCEVGIPTDDDAPHVVILEQAIQPNTINWAIGAGITPAVVNMTENGHQYCGTRAGETQLYSRASGSIEIVYTDATTATGGRWSLVRIGTGATGDKVEQYAAYTQGVITAGSGGPATRSVGVGFVDLYEEDAGQLVVRSGGINVWNFWSIEIPADQWIWVERMTDGRLYVTNWDEEGTTQMSAAFS